MERNLFKNKYRTQSIRLSGWDYSWPGVYFMTICIKNREMFFGDVVDGQMVLNNTGKIANQFWQEIPMHFSHVVLDKYIIMPNHVHGIIIIRDDTTRNNTSCRDAIYRVSMPANNTSPNNQPYEHDIPCGVGRDTEIHIHIANRDAINRVSTGGTTGIHNPMGKGTSGEIVRWFKGRTKFEIGKKFKNSSFSWQPRFYDRIIRNQKSLIKARVYILDNPYK